MSVIQNPPERADHFYACAGAQLGMHYAKIQAKGGEVRRNGAAFFTCAMSAGL
ncbi:MULTISPECIES: hypothetical protein [Bradyrhizobium]|jgi:hypothetical protein|uniref:hypothetical protein n=1 Tax=Bradyrhizobium TaxID=374 RepID=UPI0004026F8B|nr:MULTISPECIES: hypothetical protein [Bradyrhizobium]